MIYISYLYIVIKGKRTIADLLRIVNRGKIKRADTRHTANLDHVASKQFTSVIHQVSGSY